MAENKTVQGLSEYRIHYLCLIGTLPLDNSRNGTKLNFGANTLFR